MFGERKKTEDDLRQEYWVEFYKKYNIEYIPNKSLYYDYMTADSIDLRSYYYSSRATRYLLDEFVDINKNTSSFSVACDYWISSCATQGIKCKKEDIQEAYNLAYGYGCEYEFENL